MMPASTASRIRSANLILRSSPGLEQAPAEQVDGKRAAGGGREDAPDAGMPGIDRGAVRHHDPDRCRPLLRRPLGDDLGHRRIGRVHRLDEPEPSGMPGVDLDRVARIEAVHGVGGDQQGPVDADRVHRGDHVVAGDLRGAGENPRPGAARAVALVGMDLGVDGRHGAHPLFSPSVLPRPPKDGIIAPGKLRPRPGPASTRRPPARRCRLGRSGLDFRMQTGARP